MHRRSFYVGIAVLFLFFSLTTGFQPAYFLLYGLLMSLGLGISWSWIQSKGIEATISQLTLRPQVGRPVLFRITLKESLGLPRYNIKISVRGIGLSHMETVVNLERNATLAWTFNMMAISRGQGTAGDCSVAASDPLGLTAIHRSLTVPNEILIYPGTNSLSTSSRARLGGLGEGGDLSRRIHESTFASKIREYRPGDSLRTIHWPSTARLGDLMTKEFDGGGETEEVWLLLDMQRSSNVLSESYSTAETGITIAASLAEILISSGKSVGLIANGGKHQSIIPENSDDHFWNIMKVLALIEAEGTVNVPSLVAQSEVNLDPGSRLVVIAPWPENDLAGIPDFLIPRGVTCLFVLLDAGSFGQRQDPRWMRDYRAEFPVGATLVKNDTDPAEVLLFIAGQLVI